MEYESVCKKCELSLNTLPLFDGMLSCNNRICHFDLTKRASYKFLSNLALDTRQVVISHMDYGGKKKDNNLEE